MTRLDVLLNELCPDGVPFKRLEECCILEKGKTPIQKAIPGEYPLVVTTNERKSSNTFQFDQPSVCIPLVSSRGHGVACLNQVYYQEGCFALGNILCAVTPLKEGGLSAKFLYYYLNLKKDTLIVPLMKGGANVSLTVNSLKKVKVAIPPLLVQDEIVERLQTFEALLDTLSSELSARRKQYEYYRSELLSFENKVDICELKDVAIFKTGSKPDNIKEDAFDGGYEYVNAGTSCSGYVSEANCSGDVVTTPSRGQGGIGFVGYQSTPFWLGPLCYRISAKDATKVKNKYLYYCLANQTEDILARKKEGGVPALNASDLGTIKINIPSLKVQERIISVLDNFETICADLNIGLPAEIEARQKQYEYYR
ncbi:MAG: restriction endonuclease subunit S, partial [Eubacterium sp.]|nr:restriction endonuclease subunit S [Eubacterium sp.]